MGSMSWSESVTLKRTLAFHRLRSATICKFTLYVQVITSKQTDCVAIQKNGVRRRKASYDSCGPMMPLVTRFSREDASKVQLRNFGFKESPASALTVGSALRYTTSFQSMFPLNSSFLNNKLPNHIRNLLERKTRIFFSKLTKQCFVQHHRQTFSDTVGSVCFCPLFSESRVFWES